MVIPVVHATWVAAGLFLMLLGLVVFATRPAGALNRVLGALLFLRGASDVFYEFMRDSATPEQAWFNLRVANWFDWPTVFLTLLFLHMVSPPRRHPRARTALLAVAGVLTVGLVAAFVREPSLIATGIGGEPGAFYGEAPGLLTHTFLTVGFAVQVAAVLLAARDVISPSLTVVQRRRAALVGLSFALLVGQFGLLRAMIVAAALVSPSSILVGQPAGNPAWLAGGAVGVVGFVLVVAMLPRLAGAFDGRSRKAVLAVGLLSLAGGLLTAVLTATIITGLPPFPVATNNRFLFVAASAACLALALVRYGLAGFGEPTQRRVASVAHVALVAALGLLPVGVVLLLLGANSAGLIAAFVLALGALTFSQAPVRAAAEALSRLLLVSPSDPAAAAERARSYTAELHRRRSAEGHLPDAADPALAAMRQELGMTERDHAMLVELLPDAARSPEPPLLGRYRVERELGRGAFGTASLALDTATGQKVVLKRFHADWMEQRALAEARALAAVRHPRVVPMLALERVGSEVFLVLGYVPGGTAEQLLAREGPLPAARAASLAADVLEGLSALHAAGLAHGDVKPSNVFLDADGRAVLGDLGAAQLEQGPAEGTVTMSPVVGSMATLAPEVLRGARKSAASDLYSAGATLYRLLTGGHYVDVAGKAPAVAVELVLNHPPNLPHRRVPGDLEAVLRRALAKRPVDRYGSADEMRAAVLAAGGPRAGSSPARRPAHSPAGSAAPG